MRDFPVILGVEPFHVLQGDVGSINQGKTIIHLEPGSDQPVTEPPPEISQVVTEADGHYSNLAFLGWVDEVLQFIQGTPHRTPEVVEHAPRGGKELGLLVLLNLPYVEEGGVRRRFILTTKARESGSKRRRQGDEKPYAVAISGFHPVGSRAFLDGPILGPCVLDMAGRHRFPVLTEGVR